jgi:hypothetical protein
VVKATTEDAGFSFTTDLPQPKSLMPQGFSPFVVVWYFLFLSSEKEKRKIIIYIRTQRKYHTVFYHRGLAQRQCEPIRTMNGQHSPAREEGVMHRFVIPYSWSHRQSCRRFFYFAAGHCTERGKRE